MNPLARDFLGGLDRVEFARQCDLEPDAHQAAFLRSTARNKVVVTSRQLGKSTMSALEGAADAWYDVVHPEARAVLGPKAHALVLITSPSQRQSDETFAKLQGHLGRKIAGVVEAHVRAETVLTTWERKPGTAARVLSSEAVEEWKVRSLTLTNGARVVSLPGAPETVRGFSSVTRVIVDEAGFAPPGLLGALRPMMLVSRGSLSMLSTPNGKRGEFYDACSGGGEDWERYTLDWTKNPRISREDVERERRLLPAWLFAQEYECTFTSLLGAVFHESDIEGALVDDERTMNV